MDEKVIHISEETHKRAKEWCKEQGLKMKEWIETLIYKTLNEDTNVSLTKKEKLKYLSIYPEPEIPPESLPPFWERENRKEINNEN